MQLLYIATKINNFIRTKFAFECNNAIIQYIARQCNGIKTMFSDPDPNFRVFTDPGPDLMPDPGQSLFQDPGQN